MPACQFEAGGLGTLSLQQPFVSPWTSSASRPLVPLLWALVAHCSRFLRLIMKEHFMFSNHSKIAAKLFCSVILEQQSCCEKHDKWVHVSLISWPSPVTASSSAVDLPLAADFWPSSLYLPAHSESLSQWTPLHFRFSVLIRSRRTKTHSSSSPLLILMAQSFSVPDHEIQRLSLVVDVFYLEEITGLCPLIRIYLPSSNSISHLPFTVAASKSHWSS